jgi:hypothetical protein
VFKIDIKLIVVPGESRINNSIIKSVERVDESELIDITNTEFTVFSMREKVDVAKTIICAVIHIKLKLDLEILENILG